MFSPALTVRFTPSNTVLSCIYAKQRSFNEIMTSVSVFPSVSSPLISSGVFKISSIRLIHTIFPAASTKHHGMPINDCTIFPSTTINASRLPRLNTPRPTSTTQYTAQIIFGSHCIMFLTTIAVLERRVRFSSLSTNAFVAFCICP